MKHRYFLMRHGESEAMLADLVVSSPEIGCHRYGLSPQGKEQARVSALQSGLGADTRILCSDFVRARETAQIAAEVLGCPPPVLEPALRERHFGQLEGTSAASYQQVWQQDALDPDSPPFGVESARQVTRRLSQLVEQLESAGGAQTFLLVGHGDPLRFLQMWAAGLPLSQSIPHFGPAEIRPLDLERVPKATGQRPDHHT